jgi:hypothetical protein
LVSTIGGESVSQPPLKDKAFLTFLDQNPPFELPPKRSVLQSGNRRNEGGSPISQARLCRGHRILEDGRSVKRRLQQRQAEWRDASQEAVPQFRSLVIRACPQRPVRGSASTWTAERLCNPCCCRTAPARPVLLDRKASCRVSQCSNRTSTAARRHRRRKAR